MRKATPPPPPTSSTLFERKAVVLSSSITSSGNDPASNVDAIGTISDAFDQAKRAGARFFDGLELNLPHFGKGINANVDANANANAVKLFLRNFSNAATKAAEMVVSICKIHQLLCSGDFIGDSIGFCFFIYPHIISCILCIFSPLIGPSNRSNGGSRGGDDRRRPEGYR